MLPKKPGLLPILEAAFFSYNAYLQFQYEKAKQKTRRTGC